MADCVDVSHHKPKWRGPYFMGFFFFSFSGITRCNAIVEEMTLLLLLLAKLLSKGFEHGMSWMDCILNVLDAV